MRLAWHPGLATSDVTSHASAHVPIGIYIALCVFRGGWAVDPGPRSPRSREHATHATRQQGSGAGEG